MSKHGVHVYVRHVVMLIDGMPIMQMQREREREIEDGWTLKIAGMHTVLEISEQVVHFV